MTTLQPIALASRVRAPGKFSRYKLKAFRTSEVVFRGHASPVARVGWVTLPFIEFPSPFMPILRPDITSITHT